MTHRRFIEVDFPIRTVSEHSAREKNIRHGHISPLPIRWARRFDDRRPGESHRRRPASS